MDISPWLMTFRREKDQVHFVSRESCARSTNLQPNAQSLMDIDAFDRESLWTGIRCLSPLVHNPRPALGGSCSSVTSDWTRNVSDGYTSDNCLKHNANEGIFPRQRRLITGDLLIDLTNFNISDYILNDKTIPGECYGGITIKDPTLALSDPLSSLLNSTLEYLVRLGRTTSGEHAQNSSKLTFVDLLSTVLLPPTSQVQIWYNNKGFVSSPAYLNMLHNMEFRLYDTTAITLNNNESSLGLVVASHPLPFPEQNWLFTLRETMMFEAAFAPFLIIALTALTANFAIPLVSDRHSGLKHLQSVSGLQPCVYWLVNFICDFGIYAFVSLCSVILLTVFGRTAFIDSSVVVLFIAVVLLYGAALIPWVYLLTFLFDHPSTAFVVVSSVNIFLSSVTLSVDLLLRLLLLYDLEEATQFAATLIRRIMLTVFPHYCFASSILDLTVVGFLRTHDISSATQLLRKMPLTTDKHWSLLSLQLLCLFLQTVVLFATVLLVEYRLSGWLLWDSLCGLLQLHTRGSNVLHSQTESLNPTDAFTEPVINICRLTKRYPGQSRPALDNLTLSVQAGECFGLLGTNGAGKSTTFGLLSGQHPVRRNTVKLKGIDFSGRQLNRQSGPAIGYCPQRDALHPFLTAWETLWVYGQLRGLSGMQLNATVDRLLKSVGLTAYAHQLNRTFSGGTKRKLSTAIAFIGDPEIILLDEPSSGMDPSARRLLWYMVRSAVRRQRAVLLSSHCMDECESLCTRVGLLVDGRLRCMGKPMELKRRFNVGYQVDFELSEQAMAITPVSRLQSELDLFLPNIRLSFPLYTRQQYYFEGSKPLSALFAGLGHANSRGLLKHFSVKHSTLEDVFLKCITSPTTLT